MAITNLGAVGISAGGAYNPGTVYKKYKIVSENGGSYMYIHPTPAAGVPVTDTSHWQQIASVGGQDILDAVTAEKNAAIAAKVLAEGYAAQLAAGTASPASTYANLAALNDGTPTAPNVAKIYITLDDGKWCYYNGSAWVAGGVYQATERPLDTTLSVSGMAADAKVTGDKVGELKSDLSTIEDDLIETDTTDTSILLPYRLKSDDSTSYSFGNDVEIYDITNMFNKSAWVANKRYNDSGDVVDDATSGYVNQLVPIIPNGVIYTNVPIQRIYAFDKNKTFLRRNNGVGTGRTKLQNVQTDTAWAMFQFAMSDIDTSVLNTAIITMLGSQTESIPSSYTAFTAGTENGYVVPNATNVILSDTYTTMDMCTSPSLNYYAGKSYALFSTVNVWEPSEADSGYSNPTSGSGRDTSKADWTATDKYDYYGFLAHYYDPYVGVNEETGYKVTKRSLGQDSSNTGYELFEYDFCPLNYRYTVLLSAGMNADETQGIWGLATFMRCVMNDEETNCEIMHKNIRFKVIPIINASGFDTEPIMRYLYSDGVNPNFNWDYKKSWYDQSSTAKGDYPDSNIGTVILKKWVNENSGKACLWLDLHTGRWVVTGGTNKKIMDFRVPYADEGTILSPIVDMIKAYYVDKGYISASDIAGSSSLLGTNPDYQKTNYAYDICGMYTVMPEMHLESTGYGQDGYTNNAPAGIKAYVLQIRMLVIAFVNASKTGILPIDYSKSARANIRY